MPRTNELIDGYKRFIKNNKDNPLYKDLAKGQNPKSLIIACSDSRVDPSIVTDANLGDLFIIRNVANLVPPYEPMIDSHHGTSAAIEFAVNILEVNSIIVMGHSNCAGIKSLVESNSEEANSEEANSEFSFVKQWVNIAIGAKKRNIGNCNNNKEYCSYCEKEAIKISIENLKTFPWIKSKVEKSQIKIHGWYLSLEDIKLFKLQEDKFIEV